MRSFLFLTIIVLLGFLLPHLTFAQSSSSGFVPLTNIPGLTDSTNNLGTNSSMAGLLNGLYKICIGIAVVLSVLQLVRAGIMYMLGGSISSVEEAKHLIMTSILGLILVLSPYIVFSIINPQILTLNVDVSPVQLNSNQTAGGGIGTNPGSGSGSPTSPTSPTSPGSGSTQYYIDAYLYDSSNSCWQEGEYNYTDLPTCQAKAQQISSVDSSLLVMVKNCTTDPTLSIPVLPNNGHICH